MSMNYLNVCKCVKLCFFMTSMLFIYFDFHVFITRPEFSYIVRAPGAPEGCGAGHYKYTLKGCLVPQVTPPPPPCLPMFYELYV